MLLEQRCDKKRSVALKLQDDEMATLTEMFHPYLAELFPVGAKFVDDGEQRLRIVYDIPETAPGRRYGRPIVVVFDCTVIDEFQAAVNCKNLPRQQRIGDAARETVRRILEDYDAHGPRDSAFAIDIDSEDCDLSCD